MPLNKKSETHPAFGLVQFNRVTGKTKLFGSKLEFNDNFIELKVCRAEREHDLGRDHYFGRKEIIQVWLSAAQFAELLTTMNFGSGVPCTIKHVQEERQEELPIEEKTEPQRVVDNFQDFVNRRSEEFVNRIRKTLPLLKDKKHRLTAAEREEIGRVLDFILQDVQCNMSFYLEQYMRAAEKVEKDSKAEIEAAFSHVVTTLGLERLQMKALEQRTESRQELPMIEASINNKE